MQIIEVNHKTVANLLKKSAEKFWLDNNRDAYIQFTDGSVVCIHALDYKWETYVALDGRKATNNATSFSDSQEVYLWHTTQGDESLFTSRTGSITQLDSMSRLLNFITTKREKHGSKHQGNL